MDPRWKKLEQAKGNDGRKKKEMKLKQEPMWTCEREQWADQRGKYTKWMFVCVCDNLDHSLSLVCFGRFWPSLTQRTFCPKMDEKIDLLSIVAALQSFCLTTDQVS